MSNSKLISYTNLSPSCNKPRNKPISKITIHHMAGNMSAKACVDMFANPSRKGSCNYAIGTDGKIALGVDEANRSWCSSNSANDHMAITIEVANDGGTPDWHVSDKAIKSLVNLCADICKRNKIDKLNYTGDKKGNVTTHQMFVATACPGPYLKSKIPYVVDEVNKALGKTEEKETIYRVKKTWKDEESQIGAFKSLDNAISACKDGYNVFDENGKVIYSNNKSKDFLVKVTANVLNVRAGAGTNYKVVGTISDNGTYTIVEEKNGWGKLKSGAGWISLNYTDKI